MLLAPFSTWPGCLNYFKSDINGGTTPTRTLETQGWASFRGERREVKQGIHLFNIQQKLVFLQIDPIYISNKGRHTLIKPSSIKITLYKLAKTCLKVILYVPIFIFGVIYEMFSHSGSDLSGGGRSDYNLGKLPPTVRPESYRKMKRRNRLMRKFDHKNDPKK